MTSADHRTSPRRSRRSSSAQTNEMPPVVIVGLGAAGGFAASGLKQAAPELEIKGVDLLGADAPSAHLVDGPVLRDVAELDGPVRLAIVSTPTPTHAATLASLAGLDAWPTETWVEKPGAPDRQSYTTVAAMATRTLWHFAFAPEVLWAVERMPEWLERHGQLQRIDSSFDDPYGDIAEEKALVLGDSWSDSGSNALSVVARFTAPGAVTAANDKAPYEAHAHFHIARCEIAVRTRWVDDNAKATMLTFADGTNCLLSHHSGTGTLANHQTEFEHVAYGHGPLADRYAVMLRSYIDEDDLVFDAETEAAIYGAFFDARERMATI